MQKEIITEIPSVELFMNILKKNRTFYTFAPFNRRLYISVTK